MLRLEAMSCIPTFYATNQLFPTTTSFGCGHVFRCHFHYSERYKKWQKKLLLVQQLFELDYANTARLMAKFVYP